MDHSFDRKLKQKLEDQSPEALGYRPDRERMWQQISGRQKRKPFVLPAWASHAAAVAAGLLIGILLLSRHREAAPLTAMHTLPAIAATGTRTDTVYVPQATQTRFHNTAIAPTPRRKSTLSPAAAAIRQQPQPAIQQPEEVAPVKEETPAVAVVRPQPKVMYLSDMENENSLPKPREKQQLAFLKILSNQNGSKTNTGTESVSLTVIRQFSAAKN